MGAALVPMSGAPERAAVNDLLLYMERVTEWCESTNDVAALIDAEERSRLIRELAKIKKMSSDVIQAATRMQMLVLRRLGVLNQGDALKSSSQVRTACRTFAAMPDDAFAAAVAAVDGTRTAISVAVEIRRANEHRDYLRTAADTYQGVGPTNSYFAESYHQVAEAASTLLESLEAETFTIASAADELVNLLRLTHSPLEYEAIKSIVHHAIMSAPAIEGTGLPQFVTYNHEELGWCRIPIGVASVAQFRWMVEYRHTQLAAVQAKVDTLDALLEAMEQGSKGSDQAKCHSSYIKSLTRRQATRAA
jgi:hypothetical protein